MRLLSTDDVRPCLHESFLAKPVSVRLVSSSRDVRGGRGDRPPGRRGRRLSWPASAPQTRAVRPTVAVSNRLPPGSARQIQIASEHIARVAGLRFMPVLGSPPLPRLRSGRSRSSDEDRCHATCRSSYTFKSRWRSLRTASRDPSCRSMCASLRPVSRRNSQRAMP